MAYDRLVTSLDRLLGSRLDAGPPLDFPDGPVGDRCREVVTRTGHGSFMDGFVHLFVQPLRDLDPCLRAWSFLDDALRRRWVIGKNALGALIAMDDPTGGDGTLRVALVDPLRVSVFSPEDLTLDTLHDRWLGQQRLPGFFDDGLYRQVSSAVGEPLDFGLMLAPKHPMGRGGRLEACNVQVEPLLEYYRSTGPIYERTLQRTQESQARPEGAPAAPPPPQDVGDPTLASILSEQRDPNAPLDDGSPPLCRAAVAGALLQARKLLAAGADPRIEGPDGRSALQVAIDRHEAELVRRYRNAARTMARKDGRPGVEVVDASSAAATNHIILALRGSIGQVGSQLKRAMGWKPTRDANERPILLEAAQAIGIESGAYTLLFLHEVEGMITPAPSSHAVSLSMRAGPALQISGDEVVRFESGHRVAAYEGDAARAALAEAKLTVPQAAFATDHVCLTLELLAPAPAPTGAMAFEISRFDEQRHIIGA